jgi:hypothetical protein
MVDIKISELPEDTTPTNEDYLMSVDTSTIVSKKISIENMFNIYTNQELKTTSTPTFNGADVSGGTIYGDFEVLSGTLINVNWNNGNHKMLTLSANTELTFTNALKGSVFSLSVTQGATSYILTLPLIEWLDIEPILKTDGTTIISLIWDGDKYVGDWK